ncbi:AHH domain-containing protein [Archangium primigenium]|uniref:AHH domain-containing protein n=1 Tax=[Archangium] primigenium TaxID=2792470 RepID=UPI001958AE0C|nr:AHH domain-containing protein [Archangium primigenium]MBM7112707.1 AHH domain-containing protein [Archangium primigenium]
MSVKIGFVDHRDGTNLRSLPAELPGSKCLTNTPLPPGTRVCVTGPHAHTPEWLEVAAYLDGLLLSGYVQAFRINTDLPEPCAKLHHIQRGDKLEPIAARIYRQGITPGRDLRYYENVVLHVNQHSHRAGIQKVNGDIRLVEGHRIWLVSVAFAQRLQGHVESGSLTGGMLVKARDVGRHLDDILTSVTTSPRHFGSVGGQYKDAIREHLPQIVSIVVIFITAELASAILAAAPTGVSQLAAALIQLGLAAFGAKDMIDAGVEAVKHATEWLTHAWTAHGDSKRLEAASKSFLQMLMSIAMAALAKAGVKSNFTRGMTLARGVKISPPRLEYMAVASSNGHAVAVPVFRPGSITSTATAMAMSPKPGIAAALSHGTRGTRATETPTKPTENVPDDVALEQLLEKAPNGEALKPFVGRPVPKPGTLEFHVLKKELEQAGYVLDVVKDGTQPVRLRRLKGQTHELAQLTVTEKGLIALKADGPTRISMFSRYRKNYLDLLRETAGEAASKGAEARISAGNQLHHLIPDGVAQSHPLILEALERLKGYTVDRGTNIIDMPSIPNAQGQLMHLGNHPKYSNYVRSRLTNAQRALGPLGKVTPQHLHQTLLKIENELRQAIQDIHRLPPEVLKEIVEDGIVVGKKLALLERPSTPETFPV